MSANTAVAGQRITAAWLNTNIPGPWTPIAPLAGYANVSGQVVFQCRLFNSVTVQVIGTLTKPSSGTDGDVIGQLPAGMIPGTTQAFNGNWTSISTIHGANLNITVRSSGQIVLFSSALPSTSYINFAFSGFVTLDG